MGKYRYNLATSNPSGNSSEYTSNLYKKDGCFLCFNKCQIWPRIHLRASRPLELSGAKAAADPGPRPFGRSPSFQVFSPLATSISASKIQIDVQKKPPVKCFNIPTTLKLYLTLASYLWIQGCI